MKNEKNTLPRFFGRVFFFDKRQKIGYTDSAALFGRVNLTKGFMQMILSVTDLTHGFGDRAIFQDVSFRMLKGEHIGLVGANGEGKSTFMNIITAP